MGTHPDIIGRERRSLLKPVGAGRAIAAVPAGALLVQKNPKTNGTVPAIGFGKFMTFDSLPGTDKRSFIEVMRRPSVKESSTPQHCMA